MAPVFPFWCTTYGAGFSAAYDPTFPISATPGGLMTSLNRPQRVRINIDRRKALQVDRTKDPFLIEWFLPIRMWGKTLQKTVEDNLKNLVYPARLLNLSLFRLSQRTKEHPKSDIVIVAQVETREARPDRSQLRNKVYPEILSLLSSPKVGRPEIGCYVEYALYVDPRRMTNPLGIQVPEEAAEEAAEEVEEDLTRTPKWSSSGSSSSDSRPSSPITDPADSDGPQPPEDVDEEAKEKVDSVGEFFDMDAYEASDSPAFSSTES